MDSEDPRVGRLLQKITGLLTKEMVEIEPHGKDALEITYDDGSRIRVTLTQIDPPRGEVLH